MDMSVFTFVKLDWSIILDFCFVCYPKRVLNQIEQWLLDIEEGLSKGTLLKEKHLIKRFAHI